MDPRYVRTENDLVNACLELGKKRPLRSLSVKEVSQKARINRITFYSHYSDMDELAGHIEDLAIQEWLEFVSPVTDYLHDTEKFIRRSLQYSAAGRFGKYMTGDIFGLYNSRAYDKLCQKILEESGISDSRMKKRLYFAIHGSASLFHLNLIQDDSDIREAAEMIHMMVTLT